MLTDKRKETIEHTAQNRQRGLVVVLEDIHDPHNAAALFRSCDAFGVQDAFLVFKNETPFNPETIGKTSSSSANKWLTFHTFPTMHACLSHLKKEKYTTLATVPKTGEDIFSAPLTEEKLAILVGNEHRGLSETAIEHADRRITIPMRGMVQSLNVSVSAALVLFEVTRQRSGKKRYTRSPADVEKLIKDLTRRA